MKKLKLIVKIKQKKDSCNIEYFVPKYHSQYISVIGEWVIINGGFLARETVREPPAKNIYAEGLRYSLPLSIYHQAKYTYFVKGEYEYSALWVEREEFRKYCRDNGVDLDVKKLGFDYTIKSIKGFLVEPKINKIK